MESKIKTLEDACILLGLDPTKALLDVSGMPVHHQSAIIAHAKLVIITEALNQEANDGKPWKPDWTNDEWDKYYPWFDMSSGSGLSFDVVDVQYSTSGVGSRLCFKTEDVADYAGNQFIDLYKEYFLL